MAEPDQSAKSEARAGTGARVHRLKVPEGSAKGDAVQRMVPAETLGGELRDARESVGLSLAEVANRTKVRPGILELIEGDEHGRLPALTYTIGFIKAYARTVGLDPEAAATRYRLESNKGEPVPTLVDLEPLEERRLPSRGLVLASLVAVLLLLAGLVGWAFGLFQGDMPAEPGVKIASTAENVPGAPVAPVVPAVSPPAAGPVRLTAKDEVWLRIADADGGERFFEGTLGKGQFLDLPPGRRLLLRTGRAGAIEVRVGDRVLAPLGGPVDQLRDLPLDAESLVAKATPRAGLAEAAQPLP